MKDRQAKVKASGGSIWGISPLLHWAAMPVLVFLRHGFGYAFLGPKSIFLACIFATGLLSYIVWHDPAFRPTFMRLSVFALLASLLYLIHLMAAIIRQAKGNAEHDQDSGTSYLLGLTEPVKWQKREGFIHAVVEPAVSIIAGWLLSPDPLGRVLMGGGIALFFKELIRHWFSIRHRKQMKDNMGDAKETITLAQPEKPQPLPSDGRTRRERHQRRYEADDSEKS